MVAALITKEGNGGVQPDLAGKDLAMESDTEHNHNDSSMMIEQDVPLPHSKQIDPLKARFPYCIVWTPLPVISWLLPFVGHVGIGKEDGVILDFAGPNFICVDKFAFGAVSRYIQINKENCSITPNPSTMFRTEEEYRLVESGRNQYTCSVGVPGWQVECIKIGCIGLERSMGGLDRIEKDSNWTFYHVDISCSSHRCGRYSTVWFKRKGKKGKQSLPMSKRGSRGNLGTSMKLEAGRVKREHSHCWV